MIETYVNHLEGWVCCRRPVSHEGWEPCSGDMLISAISLLGFNVARTIQRLKRDNTLITSNGWDFRLVEGGDPGED